MLGPIRAEAGLDVGVAHLSPQGPVDRVRALRFPDYGARLPNDLSLAVDGHGGVLVVGHLDFPMQPRADLVLAHLDAVGRLVWQRALQRPYPNTQPHWTVGPISQRASFAPDGVLYVAATALYQREGSTHLVLLELGTGGEVLRQAALSSGTQQIVEVHAMATAVRVRGAFFFDCTFERESLAGCDASLALPPLVGLSTPTELGARPAEARAMATQSHLMQLTPGKPPE